MMLTWVVVSLPIIASAVVIYLRLRPRHAGLRRFVVILGSDERYLGSLQKLIQVSSNAFIQLEPRVLIVAYSSYVTSRDLRDFYMGECPGAEVIVAEMTDAWGATGFAQVASWLRAEGRR